MSTEWISLSEGSCLTSSLHHYGFLAHGLHGFGFQGWDWVIQNLGIHGLFCLSCSYFPCIDFNSLLGVLAFGGSFGAVNRRTWRCLRVLAEYEF